MANTKSMADISRSAQLIGIFSSKHQIPADMMKSMTAYQVKRVRQVATGAIPEISRGERIKALRILSNFGRPNDCALFGQIVNNRKEETDIRCAAATFLSSFSPKAAEPELIKSLNAGDDLVLSKVIKSLGNNGGTSAFKALSDIKGISAGFVAKQLAFAKALIAHRLNLDEDPLPFVKGVETRPGNEDKSLTLTIKRAQAKEVQSALKRFLGGHYGMVPAKRVGFEVVSGKAKWMMFINEGSAEHGLSKSMQSGKLILGVLARWSEETETYDAQYAVLTNPAADKKVQIMVVRSDGTVMYSGNATAKDNKLSFAVSDTERHGTANTNVSGEFTESDIVMKVGISLSKREGKLSPRILDIKELEAKFTRLKKVKE